MMFEYKTEQVIFFDRSSLNKNGIYYAKNVILQTLTLVLFYRFEIVNTTHRVSLPYDFAATAKKK